MLKKYVFFLLLSFILFFLAVNAHAWDGQRKGFILGLGLGSGVVSFDEMAQPPMWLNDFPDPDFFTKRVYRPPLIRDVKIGYAPNNFLQVYWTGKSSYFNTSGYRPGYYPGDRTIFYGIWGVGCSYFFNPSAPSPFIAIGIGISAWQEKEVSIKEGIVETPSSVIWVFWEEPPEIYYGPGVFVGGGFEFSRHWSLEIYLSWGKPGMEGLDVDSDDLGVGSVLSLQASVNVLGY